jgi:DNA-binding IclR family transcriptional regulator
MGLESVDRTMAVLNALAGGARSLPEVAAQTGLAKSTASRFLAALEEHGAAHRTADAMFALGPAIGRLADSPLATTRLIDSADTAARRLANEVQEAVCISVLDGVETRTIYQVDVPQPIRAESWVDRTWPIRPSGSAISILSTWTPTRITAVLDQLPEPDRELTAKAISNARQHPISWSDGNYVDGLTSVAAPILAPVGRATAALIIYGPSFRFAPKKQRPAVESALADAAAQISKELY